MAASQPYVPEGCLGQQEIPEDVRRNTAIVMILMWTGGFVVVHPPSLPPSLPSGAVVFIPLFLGREDTTGE